MQLILSVMNFTVSVELFLCRNHKNPFLNALTLYIQNNFAFVKYKRACVVVLGAFLKWLAFCLSRIFASD